ncbi:Rgg family transcriptional regulator [Streptococcus phocae subsp. phocae]
MFDTTDMGALIKQMRQSKKLSLKDVAGDYLSVSFLSKFERGESEISLSRFLCILENLDVSIEEIYGILSKDNPTKIEALLAKVSKAFQQNNIPALKKYYAEEIKNYQSTSKKPFLYNAIMIESFLISVTGADVNTKNVEIISDYLFDIDQWGKRELIILGNSMSAVPTNTLHLLIKEIVYKTTLFGNNEENKKVKIDIILNGISIFLDRKELNYAKYYIDVIETLVIPEVYLYERVEYNILLGTYWILLGKVEIGKKKIELALECLRNLGAESLLLTRENDYEELLNSLI